MLTGEAALDVVTVVVDVLHHLGSKCFTCRFDCNVALAHCLRGEVGVRACAVPIALLWLCVVRNNDVVIFRNAVEQPTSHVHVVAHSERVGCTDLELPLSWHYFCVRAFNQQSRFHACPCVLFDDVSTHDAACTDAAVVRALWSWLAIGFWETKWTTVQTHEGVFLFDSVNHLMRGIFLGCICTCGASVGWVWLACRCE